MPTAQIMLTWLSILPPKNDSRTIVHFAFTTANVVSEICASATFFAFIFKNAKVDFEGTVFAFCHVTVTVGMVYLALVAFLVQHGIRNVFEQLSEIYDASMFILKLFSFYLLLQKNEYSLTKILIS